MDRHDSYRVLVAKRKAHVFPPGLLNPSRIEGGRFDSQHLGPWSRWQGDLNADVVVVGQDWGDRAAFIKDEGIDSDQEQPGANLSAMALSGGWDIGRPHAPVPQQLFLTHAVLGIRETNARSGPLPAAWIEDSLPFLVALLRIVQPRALVSLGSVAYRACRLAMHGKERDLHLPVDGPLTKLRQLNPICCPGKPDWFVFSHCGPLGLANRSRELQLQDWEQLGEWLRLRD